MRDGYVGATHVEAMRNEEEGALLGALPVEGEYTRSALAETARQILAMLVGEWPEISERTVRLYQQQGIVGAAHGTTRGAWYDTHHVLETVAAALYGRIRSTSLKEAAEQVPDLGTELLEGKIYELVRAYKEERAVGPPRPLPKQDWGQLDWSAAVEAGPKRHEQMDRIHLSRGVTLDVPRDVFEEEDFEQWVISRIRSFMETHRQHVRDHGA